MCEMYLGKEIRTRVTETMFATKGRLMIVCFAFDTQAQEIHVSRLSPAAGPQFFLAIFFFC